MQDVVVVCPQERDYVAIRAARLDERYRVHYVGTDLDRVEDFDPHAFLEACDDVPADGVVGTKDRSALLAALIAKRRGLPGPDPQAVLACQLKTRARAIAARVVPEATPRFALLDGRVDLDPPFFVKPVVGRLSQLARRVDDPAELASLVDDLGYASGYARIAELAGVAPEETTGFLVEELLEGAEVTLEGYVHRGEVTVIGVTDSIKYPGADSFERFEYPTRLPPSRVRELEAVAARLLPALGFDGGFFNVEFFVPEDGAARITEVNARIASQFARLVQRLDGCSTYDALFALACGADPAWRNAGNGGAAISYCVRVFDDAWVHAVPEPEDGLEVLVSPGSLLSSYPGNDPGSFRLCIFDEAAPSREQALARCRERAARLRNAFELEPASARIT